MAAVPSWPTAFTNTTQFADIGFYTEGALTEEELYSSQYLQSENGASSKDSANSVPPPKSWVSLLDRDNCSLDQKIFDVEAAVTKAGISFHNIPFRVSDVSETLCANLVTTVSEVWSACYEVGFVVLTFHFRILPSLSCAS